jgi:hypothetical protein
VDRSEEQRARRENHTKRYETPPQHHYQRTEEHKAEIPYKRGEFGCSDQESASQKERRVRLERAQGRSALARKRKPERGRKNRQEQRYLPSAYLKEEQAQSPGNQEEGDFARKERHCQHQQACDRTETASRADEKK